MYVCAGGRRGWQTYPKLDQIITKKNPEKNILFHGWGGVAIAKDSNFNVNFLKKKKKSPSCIFINYALKKVGPGLKRGGAVP